MDKKIQLLDCTLRDGAYVVDGEFGVPAIRGIIKKMEEANVDIIECGWLKDSPYRAGSSYFHVPADLESFIDKKNGNSVYAVMIDWDRYDLNFLPENNGKSIDAIRVVFPHGKHREGIAVGKEIEKKNYFVFYQAANTLAYSEEDLLDLADCVNQTNASALSVVDTFGAMYFEDLERIVRVLDGRLNKKIKLGFHSHNNQQLSFALSMRFVELTESLHRGSIVDSSLCGMGRGAGNATTELLANYLNEKYNCNYDLNVVMDSIDMYMQYFQERYEWGYSIPYFIAGMYCCHVNNIAYLLKNHRTNAKDMKNIIESLSPSDRRKYDYDLLENRYLENQSRIVDDEKTKEILRRDFENRKILLIAPGKTSSEEKGKIENYIKNNDPIIIAVNALNTLYRFDYLFAINHVRYDYAKDVYKNQFANTKKILLSNIKAEGESDEYIVNFNSVIKRGWEHFDNAVIVCLRLLEKLNVREVAVAGFDGFKTKYGDSYADVSLPVLKTDNKWEELNEEICAMFKDFLLSARDKMKISFVTESIFSDVLQTVGIKNIV